MTILVINSDLVALNFIVGYTFTSRYSLPAVSACRCVGTIFWLGDQNHEDHISRSPQNCYKWQQKHSSRPSFRIQYNYDV